MEIDPLRDPRWPEFLLRHPSASVFHTPGWLEALQRTYGYKPSALMTAGAGLVFCRVDSWITGRRLVSLPFSDFCEPLADSPEDLRPLLEAFQALAKSEGVRYAELRPLTPLADAPSQTFYHHRLDLRPGADALFRGFHKDCIQRKIRRAERERIVIEAGGPEDFHALMLKTRRRHGLPPQPLAWFRNLVDCLGDSLSIRLARKDGQPVAAILTLQYGKTLYYKYGASDARFHNMGAMPFLFWEAIQDAAARGLECFDLGRSDLDNEGLSDFKERLGAARSTISYWRSPAGAPRQTLRIFNQICAHLPDRCLTMLGSLVYRHIA